ncbi:DsbA family protein [Promicromonospora umidemergens]|uniref:DsbA family protein n=1 Tax=Promicromonospora umidemergens TaxID=629679 RepID=UPI0020A23AA2|nr:thioredoxin domain-containing protein [Promicromonospora umidemergens]
MVLAVAALLVVFALAMDPGEVSGERVAERAAAVEDAPTGIEQPAQPESDVGSAERHDPDDPLAAGPVDAPVTLVVFSDYQCPFCAQWSHETLPLMMDEVEAGSLRIEWRDVNVYGAASERASRAAYAAGLQGAFWEYHDALYEGGEKRSEAGLGQDALITLAAELGLDTERLATDMESKETVAQIAENQQLGLDLGAFSTPMFLMGGQTLVGAQPSQVFLDAFERALASVETGER